MLSMPLCAGESAQGAVAGSFAGWAQIDAQGRLHDFVPDGAANPAMRQAVTEQLKKVSFQPARVAGVPMAARTYLTGSYRLEPEGADYLLRIGDVRAGPKILKRVMPRPPNRLFTGLMPSISGRASFAIDARGRPVDIVVETPRTGEFAREMRDAVAQWRFEPATPAAAESSARFHQDFVAYKAGSTRPEMPGCPADASDRARVSGQGSCLSVIETVFEEPKQLGREVRVDNPH